MGQFELISGYTPGGDQPQAIEKLAAGLNEGKHFQTLLGATGTGKSVAWDEPVTIDTGGKLYRGPIGKLIDDVTGAEQTQETLAVKPPADWRVMAWDAATGNVEWQPITCLSRHKSPENMVRLRSACGREVVVTSDHSVWVLRGGSLHLLPGDAVRRGDALPVPLRLPPPENPITRLNLLEIIDQNCRSVSVDVSRLSLTREQFKTVLTPHYPAIYEKSSHIKSKGEGVSIVAAAALLEKDESALPEMRLRGKRYSHSAHLELKPEIGFLFGQYLAEGHAADRYALLSVRDSEVQAEIVRCLETSGVAYYQRKDGDFVIATRVWRDLLHNLMGGLAQNKRLPNFWPSLSNPVLAAVLRGYFEGDGGIDGGAVTATTASRNLAYDIQEAVLRFGIWARVRQVSKRKPGGAMGDYYKITISGADNLQQFAAQIGFISRRKREALCIPNANTNVDLVYGVGPRLLAERTKHALSQKDAAAQAGCSRSMISAIERGVRQPSRALFARLCRALQIEDAAFIGLASVHWAVVDAAETIRAESRYVYDFSVQDSETFLTGRGGLFVHNTYTIAQVIQKMQRPTLVLAHNKTLAAQLCSEFREFFPNNAVEYFVSYYDYYQPEAYIPQTDTFIEKDSQVNDEINRLRHASTQSILERRDTIIVASVSCIYGLGSPEEYQRIVLTLRRGESLDREEALRRLVDMQFMRNNMELTRGTFRVRGDTLEIQPADEEIVIRVEFFGDDIEKITLADPLTGEVVGVRDSMTVFPASHFVASEERLAAAVIEIELEMKERVAHFIGRNQLIEAQRIEQRTRFDLEMIRELGFCSGIENYSRILDGRAPGTAPHTLLDYFPKDFLMVIDESHQTLPQLRAMYNGDKARKDTLIEYGFRLPSAADNRPLKFHEFQERIGQTILVSATPGPYEKENAYPPVEQIIRPTGLIDPEVQIRPTKGQIDDLIEEIRATTAKGERVLVTTLTKKMAEDLTEYLEDLKIKVNYLHSDVKTMERTEILRNLRLGVHDVIVGINLLREGLDLPEVSLVAILDADKEGFLRSETSLTQTIGRAARNVDGRVILYADNVTGSMERAMTETNRRREKQVAYNTLHGVTPTTIKKAVRELLMSEKVAEETATYSSQNGMARLKADPATLSASQIEEVLRGLEKEMKEAARALNFEYAAELRDEVQELRKLAPLSDVGKDTGTSALAKDTIQYKPKAGRGKK